MNAKIFVTGGGGFVGSSVISELLARGYDVAALVHRQKLSDRGGRVVSVGGGLFDGPLEEAMTGCAGVIHLVGIIAEKGDATFHKIHVEGTRRVVKSAKKAGVRRLVHMSALGSRPEAAANYHKTKYAAEELVRDSALDWTIFRPSMIVGTTGEYMRWEAQWARGKRAPYFFMPYFGAGLFGFGRRALLQPIGVDDVARAFVDSLDKVESIGKTYPLAGPESMSWPVFHRRCAVAFTGRKKLALPVPAWYAKMLAWLLPASLLPFNWDQVVMSQEDNVADMTSFRTDFGWQPQCKLEETLRATG